MENLRIISNPFQKTFSVERDNFGKYVPFGEDSGIESQYSETTLTNHIDTLIQKVINQYGEIDTITVDGTDVDFEDCQRAVARILGPDSLVKIIQGRRLPSGKKAFVEAVAIKRNVHNSLEDYLKGHPESEVKKAMDKLEQLDNPRVNVCFLGNYSGGKSTIINALIGDSILPTAKGALTYCVWEIERSFDGSICFNGEELDNLEKLREKIGSLSKTEGISEGEKYCLKIPFSDDSALDQSVRYVFVDTPGSNNENDKRHLESLSKYLENEIDSLPIIVCLANQLTSPDFKNLLEMINNTGEGVNFLRGIFVAHDWGGSDDLDSYARDFNATCDKSNIKNINRKMLVVNPLYAMARRADSENTLDKINPKYVSQYEKSEVILPNYSYGCGETINKGKEKNPYIFNTGMYSLEYEINSYAERYSYFFKTKTYIDCLQDAIKEAKETDEKDRKAKQDNIKSKIEDVANKIVENITRAKEETSQIDETTMVAEIDKEYHDLKKKRKENKQKQTGTIKGKARDLLVEATNKCYEKRLKQMKVDLKEKLIGKNGVSGICGEADKALKVIISESSLKEETKKELGDILTAVGNVIELTVNEDEYIKSFLFFAWPNYKKAVAQASTKWTETVGKVEKECLKKLTKRYDQLLDLNNSKGARCTYKFETNQFIAELTGRIASLNEANDGLESILQYTEV